MDIIKEIKIGEKGKRSKQLLYKKIINKMLKILNSVRNDSKLEIF